MKTKYLTIAARIDARLRRQYVEYLEECDADNARGHRPHYCEHGMNMWTDYDPICGSCEEGWTMSDPLQRMRYALVLAHQNVDKMSRLLAAYATFREDGMLDAIDVARVHERFAELAS
jgi:hypothetical protein